MSKMDYGMELVTVLSLKGQYCHDQSRFQQGMESVSYFKMNTVTEKYWLMYAAATVIWPYHVGYYFQSLS